MNLPTSRYIRRYNGSTSESRIERRVLTFVGVLGLVTVCQCAAEPPPHVTAFNSATEVQASESASTSDAKTLAVGQSLGPWTLMAVIKTAGNIPAAVFEDFTDLRGHMVVIAAEHVLADLPKTMEPSLPVAPLYHGHTLSEVLASEKDLLGDEILARPGDPTYAEVAACFPPITRMFTYTFVGTAQSSDKIGFSYGGRSPSFDPAIWVPTVDGLREKFAVGDGLLGGWLPVLRFVYPESNDTWTELLAFAPFRMENNNTRVQPVWYRVARVEKSKLRWVRVVDTYIAFPPRGEPAQARLYEDLLSMKSEWESALANSMTISIPDQRLADMAKHSLVRAIMTRDGAEPKYGVVDRNYGGSEHDGFPDTFNTQVGTFCDWGLLDLAGSYIENYLTEFVRDDGSLLYRGPETGQYGRMLTVVAQFVNQGGDPAVVLKHRHKLEAIANVLLTMRRAPQVKPPDDPAFGMISGWSEADSVINPDPSRYMQPYYGNSTEAARGFHDLGLVAERLGREKNDASLAHWGGKLVKEAETLELDIQRSISRSMLRGFTPICLPAIAGVKEPFHIAVARDQLDPLHRGYRSYMEMLFSGNLTREEVEAVIRYRAAHSDSIVGLPTAYGYKSQEVAGFLTYGQAYGMLQHDFLREYLLTLYSLMAHQYTRGTWTAPETRSIKPNSEAAPYCVPAQLTVPMLTRWMLAFEDPRSETLWLAKGTPRNWLKDGQVVAAQNVPTRWGRINFSITSHLGANRIEALIELPRGGFSAAIKLRLRMPEGQRLTAVRVDGKPWADFDVTDETISLPERLSGKVSITGEYHSSP